MALTPKQEAFCRAVAEGKSQSVAYREIYSSTGSDKVCWEEASRLAHNPKLSARMVELKERALKRHDVTVDSLMAELEEARKFGKKTKQTATMVSATMGKAKIAGLIIEKSESKQSSEVKMVGKIEIVHVLPTIAPTDGCIDNKSAD